MKSLILVCLSGALVACSPNVSHSDHPDAGRIPGTCDPAADDDMDGIANGTEGCLEKPPRDTDGDGKPDYLDTDSDNDGVPDQYEDRNGDGQLGSCTTTCTDQSMCADG